MAQDFPDYPGIRITEGLLLGSTVAFSNSGEWRLERSWSVVGWAGWGRVTVMVVWRAASVWRGSLFGYGGLLVFAE
jgi:hypothetical protein